MTDTLTKTHEIRLYPTEDQEEALRARAGIVHDDTDAFFDDDGFWVWQIDTIAYRGARPYDIDTFTLIEQGGHWYARFTISPRVRPLPPTGSTVGVDLGVYWLVYASDEYRVRPNDDLPRIDKRVEKLFNDLDSKHTDSRSYRESLRQIERNQRRIYDIQLDSANKIAKHLVDNHDLICIEGIQPHGKTIQADPKYRDAARRMNWQLLIDIVKLRGYEAGRQVVVVPPYWSSQECGRCGWYTPKPLDRRTHLCNECKFKAPRDHNAALVIKRRGIEIASGSQRTDWHPIGHPRWVDQD